MATLKKTGWLILILLQLLAADFLDLYQQANDLEDIKNYNQAIVYYNKCLELEPRFAPAYNGLGFIFLELKDYTKARAYFAKAFALSPKYILPLLNIGACYYREENLTEAEKYFLKVIELDPNNVRALTNLAVVKFKYHDYFGALDYYNKAKAVDEKYLKERYNKEKSLLELKKARASDPNSIYLKVLEEKIQNEEVFNP